MTTLTTPHIVTVERMDGGVYIEFVDGQSALFPASFLFAHLPWYKLDLLALEETA